MPKQTPEIPSGIFKKIDAVEVNEEAKMKMIIEKFGDSLEVSDIHNETVKGHIRELALLPEPLIERMLLLGTKIIISNTDVPNMSPDPKWQLAPRGWKQNTWDNVPGAYDHSNNTIYMGKGKHGCTSLALHEYGHAFGKMFKLNESKNVIDAHKRLFNKLPAYERQGGAGASAGRKEFLAESFGNLFMMSKEKFVKKYDQQWYDFLVLSTLHKEA